MWNPFYLLFRLLPLVFLHFFLCLSSLTAQNFLIWNGEDSSDVSCTYDWASRINSNAQQGTYCFQGTPDPWHSPGLRLNCRNSWRANLLDYDEIWFWVKASTTGKKVRLSIYGWPYSSRSVDIDPYIVGGGGVSTSYKLVKMPLDSLKTLQYHLGAIEILYFGTSTPPSGYNIFIDDVWAMDLKPTYIKSAAILSEKTLRLDIAHRYDTTDVKVLSHYQISSPTDPDFLSPKSASNIGMHYYVEDYDPADNYNNPIPIINPQLFPQFAFPFKNGHSYTLTVSSVRDAAGNDFASPYIYTFVYQDDTYTNGTVKANHIGYLPHAPKYGYIGNWLGSAGALEINHLSPPSFELRNALTNAIVFSGTSVLRQGKASSSCGTHDPNYDLRWSGEKVFSCDFSSFTNPGKYYLYAPKYGRSYPFTIDTTAYDSAYYHTIRGLYYQRCGMSLQAPYSDSRWTHTACHLADGVIHSSHTLSSLYNNEPIGASIPMPRGWHDAGDYGKYIPSISQPLYDIFSAYELYPNKFPDGFSNIPESGNGVPDVLDEAKWEVDWLKEMQAPDGGVYFKVTTTGWPNGMPQNDTPTRWIAEKTTHSTGHFAATLAAAYRHFHPYFPVYADTCLARAKRAWNYLVLHPSPVPINGFENRPGIGGGEYGDPLGDVDERAWAAAELYKSTGETQYHTAFVTYWLQNNPNFGWNTFQHQQLKASFAYATTIQYPTNPTYVNQIKTIMHNGFVNYTIPRINESAYRSSYRSEVIPWISWGIWGQSTQFSWELMRWGAVTGDNFRNPAAINTDVQLGNNPQNRSYITGLGFNYPMDPLHHPSNSDGVVEPVPGIPVFGPHDYLGYAGYYGATQSPKNLYPAGNNSCSPYPTLRRYYDVFENVGMSEFGVEAMARTAVAFAVLSSINVPTQPLSIQSIDFFGKENEKGIALTWNTTDEIDNKGFYVDWEESNGEWKELGFVAAKGGNAHYDFLSLDYRKGQNRYRLRAVDVDGKISLSPFALVYVSGSENLQLSLFPNPAYNQLHIRFSEPQNSLIQVEMYDMLGKCVLRKADNLINQSDIGLNIEKLPVGMYQVKLITEGGANKTLPCWKAME